MFHQAVEVITAKVQERLVDSEYLVHYFDSSINALLSCRLTFESGARLIIRNAADGESLVIEEIDLEEMDLVEYGETKFVSFRLYDPAGVGSCIGRALDRYKVMIDYEDRVRAIELSFDGKRIGFFNDCDNLITVRSMKDVAVSGSKRIIELP